MRWRDNMDASLKEELINACVERILLKIPEIIGNLIVEKTARDKVNKKFFEQHPEFANNKELVASVVEQEEGKDPTIEYEKILANATPEIKKKLQMMKGLDNNVVNNPNRNLSTIDISHGEL